MFLSFCPCRARGLSMSIPGVPLRSALGYVLVAPLGRVLLGNVLSGG